jgi:predicted RNase H-like HicB family nuclease
MDLTIDLEREEDGRWIAEALELPGVMCYGPSRDEAIANVERLAIEVIADRIAEGELPSSALAVAFTIPDEQLARQ